LTTSKLTATEKLGLGPNTHTRQQQQQQEEIIAIYQAMMMMVIQQAGSSTMGYYGMLQGNC